MSTQYGLTGVAANLAFGKTGARIKDSGGIVEIRDNADAAYAVTRVALAVGADDAVPKAQLDSAVAGIGDFWVPVDVCTTGDVTLSGEQTIDGVATASSRVLVWQQASADENGIYITDAAAWSRAGDADASDEFTENKTAFCSGGATGEGITFAYTGASNPVLGVDNLAFTLKSSAAGIADGSVTAAKLNADVFVALGNRQRATVTFGGGASQPVGAQLAAQAEVERVYVRVNTAFDDSSASMTVGDAGNPSSLMPGSSVDLTTVGVYVADPLTEFTVATQVLATVSAGVSTQGEAEVILVYSRY